MSDVYKLYYWPFLPGRGEIVRLILEAAGVDYVDVGRLPESEGGGVAPIRAFYGGAGGGYPCFAPPILEHGELTLAQLPVIARYIAEREGLAPGDDGGRAHAQQIFLTLGDVLAEAHDVHHPISPALYYEDQKEAAVEAARVFGAQRLPKWVAYFSRVLEHNGGGWLVGDRLSYADLAFLQVYDGLAWAMPRAVAAALESAPALPGLRDRVAAAPRIADYLASGRRPAFNNDGIFRHYPELDLPV
jgi:glutathione S-transferase